MLGFKSINSASATLTGIELHHMLRKNNISILLINLFLNNFMP